MAEITPYEPARVMPGRNLFIEREQTKISRE